MDVEVYFFTKGTPQRPKVVRDVLELTYETSMLGGYITASMRLGRKPGIAYPEIDYRNHVEIRTFDGDKVWEGYIAAFPQQVDSTSLSFQVDCRGYVDDMNNNASWKPYYPAAPVAAPADIATIVLAGIQGYCPTLVATSGTVPATGLTATYAPDNLNTPKAHIDNLIKYGNSSNQQLYYQVWNDRVFYLTARPAYTSPLYSTVVGNISRMDMGYNGDNYFNQVYLKYKGTSDVLYYPLGVAAEQVKYASTFGSPNAAAVAVTFLKSSNVIDLTNMGEMTDAQVASIAQTLLNKFSRLAIQASGFSFDKRGAVSYNYCGPMSSAKVRAGNWIWVSDLAGMDPAIGIENSAVLVYGTSYNAVTGELQIKDESDMDIESFLSVLLSNGNVEVS